jgi:hypothetical protein
VASSLTLCIMAGWVVLAVGCYLSRVLRLVPAVALVVAFLAASVVLGQLG